MTPCALTSCHIVIGEWGDDSGSEQSGPTGVRFRQRQRIESQARDMQPIRGLGHLWRYGLQEGANIGSWKKLWDKKSLLWVYFSPSISQTNNSGLLSRIKWEIYFYNEKCLVHSLSLCSSLFIKTQLSLQQRDYVEK